MKQNKYSLIIFIILNIIGFFLIIFDKPILGSIIIISIGLILFIFPKIYYDSNSNIYIDPSDKDMISFIQIGSLLICISGISWLVYFLGVVPSIIFKYVCESHLFDIGLPFIFIIGTVFLCITTILLFLASSFGYKIYPSNAIFEHFGYDDEDKIKNFRDTKNLFIRNNTELFIYRLIWVLLFILILNTIFLFILGIDLMNLLNIYIIIDIIQNGWMVDVAIHAYIFFIALLIVICPNAIDTKRTKSSRLFTRLGGLLLMLGIMGIILIKYIINEFPSLWAVFIFKITFVLMILLGIEIIFNSWMGLDPKKALGNRIYNICIQISAILALRDN